MEVKPIHIVAASVFAFFAIVAANLLVEYRSNADFRAKLASADPSKLFATRAKLVAEENMVTQPDTEDEEE